MKLRGDQVPIWNVWWTLTVLAAIFGVIVAILEALGVFHDVGIALGVLSVIATIIFGVSASTRSSVRAIDYRLVGVDARLEGIDHRLGGLDQRLIGVDQRLGVLVNGQQATNEALIRIEELLRTRLPAA
jgi:hypothetical protein